MSLLHVRQHKNACIEPIVQIFFLAILSSFVTGLGSGESALHIVKDCGWLLLSFLCKVLRNEVEAALKEH